MYTFLFFFSSRRRHTRSVSAFLLNRSSDLIEARKKRDEIEAGKSYCSRRFGGATCDDKSAQIYARFDKNDWRIQPAEFYRSEERRVGKECRSWCLAEDEQAQTVLPDGEKSK